MSAYRVLFLMCKISGPATKISLSLLPCSEYCLSSELGWASLLRTFFCCFFFNWHRKQSLHKKKTQCSKPFFIFSILVRLWQRNSQFLLWCLEAGGTVTIILHSYSFAVLFVQYRPLFNGWKTLSRHHLYIESNYNEAWYTWPQM